MSFRGFLVALVSVLLAATHLTVSAPPADAHVRSSTGYSTVRQSGGTVTYTLSVDYQVFVRAAGLGAAALDAERPDQRAAALVQGRDATAEYLDERLRVFADGAQCPAEIDRTAVADRDGVPFAELDLVFRCHTSAPSAFTLRYDVFRPTDAVVDDHNNVVDYQLGGRSGRVVLDRRATTLSTGETSWWATAAQFVGLGFHHILAGLDHVLFVLALVLAARSLRQLIWAVSTFTVAHSVTIALAALEWVELPASIVEPLIALSIAFVAFDGLLAEPGRRRARFVQLAGIFCFGLLHGLGFAGALHVEGGDPVEFLWSLFTFNVGIELGQAAVIALSLPVLWLLRRRVPRLAGYVSAAAAVAIGVLGLLWFVERLTANPFA